MKAIISVTIDTDVILQAQKKGINMSAAAESGIMGALGESYKLDASVLSAYNYTTPEEKAVIARCVKDGNSRALRHWISILNVRGRCHMTAGQLVRFMTRLDWDKRKAAADAEIKPAVMTEAGSRGL